MRQKATGRSCVHCLGRRLNVATQRPGPHHSREVRGGTGNRPIWRANLELPGTRIDIGPLIDCARGLCPSG